jgi:hypothetical protein
LAYKCVVYHGSVMVLVALEKEEIYLMHLMSCT